MKEILSNYKTISLVNFETINFDFSGNYYNEINFTYNQVNYNFKILYKEETKEIFLIEAGKMLAKASLNKVLRHVDFDFVLVQENDFLNTEQDLTINNIFKTYKIGILNIV